MSEFIKPYKPYFKENELQYILDGMPKLEEGLLSFDPHKFVRKVNDLAHYSNEKCGYKMFRVHDIGNIVELHILYHDNYLGQCVVRLEKDIAHIEKNERNREFLDYPVDSQVKDEEFIKRMHAISEFNFRKIYNNPTQSFSKSFGYSRV
jgi:hypothetical protein